MKIKKFLNLFFNFFLNSKCLICQKETTNFNPCLDCLNKIEINTYFYCPKCFKRIPNFKKSCHLDYNYFLFFLTSFNQVIIKEMIHQLKYKNYKAILNSLDFLISKFISLNKENLEKFIDSKKTIIIPIPLHKKRKNFRGYNQAEIISEIFLKHLLFKTKINALIDLTALKRIKNNPSQTSLDFTKRELNVLNIFKLNNLKNIQQKEIIIIDDVFTSGATFKEAIKTLKKSKPKKILIFALAKT